MKVFLSFFLVFLSLNLGLKNQALGAVTQFQLFGSSNVFDVRINQNAWGVMAGPNNDPDGIIDVDPTQPYDSCVLPTASKTAASYTILPCHPNRVDGPTLIQIRFIETGEFPGTRPATAVFTRNATGSNPNPQPQELARSSGLFSSGQLASLEFTWAKVCTEVLNGRMTSEGRCLDSSDAPLSGNIPVNIGINDGSSFGQVSSQQINLRLYNPDNSLGVMPLGDDGPCKFSSGAPTQNGVCDILIIPGDGGAFLEVSLSEETRTTRFLGTGIAYRDSFIGGNLSLAYTGIRLYFFESEDPTTYFPFGNSITSDLLVDSPQPTVRLEENRISNLKNGITYTVLASSIDESGTISQFFLPTNSSSGSSALQGYCQNNQCPKVTPSQVAGIIKESDCFITTLAYNNGDSHQVKVFRSFREKILRPHFLGKKIITLYNTYGPWGALFLKKNPYAKAPTRVLLYPFYLFSKLSLNVGLKKALIILVTGLLLLVFLLKALRGQFQ